MPRDTLWTPPELSVPSGTESVCNRSQLHFFCHTHAVVTECHCPPAIHHYVVSIRFY